LQAGAYSINEVRAMEDMPPIQNDAAQLPRVPLANVNIADSTVKADMERVRMVQSLVYAGFTPEQVLKVMGLDPMDHTGLPSVQLQGVAQVDPENPDSVYKDAVT